MVLDLVQSDEDYERAVATAAAEAALLERTTATVALRDAYNALSRSQRLMRIACSQMRTTDITRGDVVDTGGFHGSPRGQCVDSNVCPASMESMQYSCIAYHGNQGWPYTPLLD